MTDFIKIKKWPAEHAQDAYDAGYYIEAIQTLHGWIEIKLREFLLLQRIESKTETQDLNFGKAWDMTNELSLNQIAKSLFVSGALPEGTLNEILSFNRVRNNITHKLFHDPYENEYLGIPKAEYDKAFHDGVNLGYIIENMSEDKISNPSFKRDA